MTGGLAFVYDKNKSFKNKINTQSVEISDLSSKIYSKHQDYLLKTLKSYYKDTKSIHAGKIIKDYKKEVKNFVMVKPKASNYKDLLNLITKVA